jgi:D-alanine transaminase
MKAVTTDELVWFNGKVMPLCQARIGLEDRGFNFADGVYEVVRFYRGRTFTLDEHMERLDRSASAIHLTLPVATSELKVQIRQLIDQTALLEGMIYLQLTRGEAPRSHPFPANTKPTLFFYARPLPAPWTPGDGEGCKIISVDDERWRRCWIKSLALLPNILAKQEAVTAGCDEAVFVHNGTITECCSSNIFSVRNGKVYTCPVGEKALPGITRLVVFRVAKRLGIPVEEVALPIDQAKAADEVFITSTTRELNWVKTWDNQPVDSGKCGPITRKLHEAYVEEVLKETA